MQYYYKTNTRNQNKKHLFCEILTVMHGTQSDFLILIETNFWNKWGANK